MCRGGLAQLFGDPDEILDIKLQRGERVVAMRIETGGDDDQVGREIIECGQDHTLVGGAKFRTAAMMAQRNVGDIPDARFRRATRTRKDAALMGRCVEDRRIVLDHILRPVPVMHVEIHDGDPFKTMIADRMARGDRGGAEEAEAHRLCLLGVMAGRAMVAERIDRVTRQHGIDRRFRPTYRAQRRLDRIGRHPRIGIQPLQACLRGRVKDRGDIFLGMRQFADIRLG